MWNLRLRTLFPSMLIIGAFCTGVPGVAGAQNYAELFASVVDGSGAPVLNLTADDFRFMIGDDIIEPADVRLDPTTPKVALLLDNGDGMYRLSADSPVRKGIEAFLETLDRGAEVGVFTLAPYVKRLTDFTTDRQEIRESASGYFSEFEAETRMMDGFLETWDRSFEAEDAWPVFVLVMGPGEDRSSYVSENEYEEFVRDLILRGATVHAVCLTSGADGRPSGQSHSLAENLAENTDGRFLTVRRPRGFEDALTQLAEHMNYHSYQMSSRYQIVYVVPDNPSGDPSVGLLNPSHSLQLFRARRLPD